MYGSHPLNISIGIIYTPISRIVLGKSQMSKQTNNAIEGCINTQKYLENIRKEGHQAKW